MRRTLAIVLTGAMLLGVLAVFAAYYSNENGNRHNYRYENYIDRDKNSICDYYEPNKRNGNDYRDRRNCHNGNRMRNNDK